MSLNVNNAPKASGSQGIAKAGTQLARLIGLVCAGKQKREYKGEAKEPAVQLYFTYELPNDKIKVEDEEYPRWIGQNRVTFSNSAKAVLPKIVRALDPADEKGGDLAAMVGSPCLLTIVHVKREGKDPYAKVDNLSALPEGLAAPDQISESIVFDFYDPDVEVFNKLPEWQRDVITSAVDYPGSKLQALINGSTQEEAGVSELAPAEVGNSDEEDRPY